MSVADGAATAGLLPTTRRGLLPTICGEGLRRLTDEDANDSTDDRGLEIEEHHDNAGGPEEFLFTGEGFFRDGREVGFMQVLIETARVLI